MGIMNVSYGEVGGYGKNNTNEKNMIISKEDFKSLCNVAKKLNDYDEMIDLWAELNDIINNIEEE